MDFFDRQEQARRQSTWLLAYFAAAVVVISVLTYFIFASVVLPFLKPLPHGPRIHSIPIAICWQIGEAIYHPLDYLRWTWDLRLFAGFAAGAALAILLGSLYKIHQLAAGGSALAELLGGRRIELDSTEPDRDCGRDSVAGHCWPRPAFGLGAYRAGRGIRRIGRLPARGRLSRCRG